MSITPTYSPYKFETERFSRPLISVLLPVYNGELYLEESIRSILFQTYDNFELIIINDGSTDDTSAIIEQFDDPRIRSFDQPNRGLATSLNRAVKLAKGKYLARQDADDISFPERFEKQVDFLETHPEYGVVGTWAEIWRETEKTKLKHKHPVDNVTLKFNLLFNTYFVHSSVMMQKTVFDKVGLYSVEKSRQPEDYELWSRIVRHGGFKVANISEILVCYREVTGSICRKELYPFTERVMNMCAENLAWASGRDLSDTAITDIAALIHKVPYKLSLRPDFKVMLSVLQESACMVSDTSNSEQTSLITQVKERYKFIRYNFLKYRLKSLYTKIIKSLLQITREKKLG